MSHGPQPAAPGPLDRLVQADRHVLAELRLDHLLPRIASAAQRLLDVDHAALGVLGRDGTVERVVGPEPDSEGGPVRVRPDPRPLASLLGDPATCSPVPDGWCSAAPIRVQDAPWARLYVADRAGSARLSSADERLLRAFADAAGLAVSNALRYDEARRGRDWSEASAEVGRQLLASASEVGVLEQIAQSLARLAEADTVQVALPVPDLEDTFELAVSRGPGAEQAQGLRYPAPGSIAREAMQHREGVVLEDVQERLRSYDDARSSLPVTTLMAFPLQGEGRPRGSVVVGRSDRRPFTPAEVEMARLFTTQAALALELADARADQSRLGLLEDRDRISRDLQHDVLQRLFGTSLTLQTCVALTSGSVLQAQLSRAITDLDETIRSIRASVFELPPNQVVLTSVASRVMATIAQLTPPSGPGPALHLSGTLGTTVDSDLAADLKAVLRQTLDLLARRGRAHPTAVHLHAGPAEISLSITHADDLLGEDDLGVALLELRQRAQSRGGDLELARPPADPELRFVVPLGAGRAAG